jgi:hypothetical protein
LHRGDFQAACGYSEVACGSGCLGNSRVAQEQFADWSHRIDALGSMFEYNLIPFPPTLQNALGSVSANAAEDHEACVRGMEA